MCAATRESPPAIVKSLHAVTKTQRSWKKSEVDAYFPKDLRKARIVREGFMEEAWAQRQEY